MRIWLLAENWPPRRGGIESYLSHIADQLGQMGHDVTVFAPRTRIKKQEERTKNVTLERRRFFWPPIRPKWLPLFISLWRRAKKDQPDIVFCGKGLFEGLIGFYLHRHLGIPYVVFTYGMEIATWVGHPATRRKLTRVLQGAQAVAYINDITCGTLRELSVEDSQLIKVLPGVDDRFLQNLSPSLVEGTIQHLNLKRPYIISVGRLVSRKGFDTLIEAFSRLDQTKYAALKLVIVGDGPEYDRLVALVTRNFLQTSVVFLRDVDDKYLPALYAGAELFALTPRDEGGNIEGFGIVYLEAGAAGRAALGTSSGGVAEAIENSRTGILVPPDDPTALAGELEQVLTDSGLRERLGKAARARVAEKFTWAARQRELNALLGPKTDKSA